MNLPTGATKGDMEARRSCPTDGPARADILDAVAVFGGGAARSRKLAVCGERGLMEMDDSGTAGVTERGRAVAASNGIPQEQSCLVAISDSPT